MPVILSSDCSEVVFCTLSSAVDCGADLPFTPFLSPAKMAPPLLPSLILGRDKMSGYSLLFRSSGQGSRPSGLQPAEELIL